MGSWHLIMLNMGPLAPKYMTCKTIITTVYEKQLGKLQKMGHNVGLPNHMGRPIYACLYQAFILMCKVFKKLSMLCAPCC